MSGSLLGPTHRGPCLVFFQTKTQKAAFVKGFQDPDKDNEEIIRQNNILIYLLPGSYEEYTR